MAGSRRGDGRRAATLVSAVAAPLVGAATLASAPTPPAKLEPLAFQEVFDAGAAGAGCSWRLPGDRRPRLTMADDHAAVKVDGRVVQLRPAPGAPELAPFTFAAWAGGGLRVRVLPGGPAQARGPLIRRRAALEVRGGTDTLRYQGMLECGD